MNLRFVFLFCVMCGVLYANTNIQDIPLPNLKSPKNLNKLHKSIALQFSKFPKRVILKKQSIVANKIAHHAFKDSKEVCSMLFLSALKDLQTQALWLGGTKVGNIKSYLDDNPKRIIKHFQCKSGILFSVVTLCADVR